MKRLCIFLLPLSLLLSLNAQEGKSLYLKANCQKCHLQGKKFDPNSINKGGKVSKVSDLKSLKRWVASCDHYFEIGWFPEEQNQVSRYLNSVYYHLKE